MEPTSASPPPLPKLTSHKQARQLLHQHSAWAMGRTLTLLEEPDANWPVLVGLTLAVIATWGQFGIKSDDHLPLPD
ncbi:MAG: hypothetical protein VKI83_06640 [Synechococcaceae cyanobacterium]|nr:hypothetical protein [Synechococcaceae cyanobacterium]